MPVEEIELRTPLIVERMEMATDSMGFGRHLGGCGVDFAIRTASGDMECISYGDGARNPPHGAAGGMPGRGGGYMVEDTVTGHRALPVCDEPPDGPRARAVGRHVERRGRPRRSARPRGRARPGSTSATGSSAAGPPARSSASSCPTIATPVLDLEATAALRAEILVDRGPRPVVDPPGPGASTWLADTMREGDEYLVNPTL